MKYRYEIRHNAALARYEVVKIGQKANLVYISPQRTDCESYIDKAKAIDRYHELRMGRT